MHVIMMFCGITVAVKN